MPRTHILPGLVLMLGPRAVRDSPETILEAVLYISKADVNGTAK